MKLTIHEHPRGMEFVNFPMMITDLDPDSSAQLDLIGEDFLDRLERIRQELAEEIKIADQFNLRERHLPHRFLRDMDLNQLNDEHDYIRLCESLTEEQVLRSLGEGLQLVLELDKPLDLSSSNITELFTNVESLTIDDNEKWKLLAFINNPLEKFKQYLQLLHRLVEPFQSLYAEVEPAIKAYRDHFKKALANGENPLDRILQLTFSQTKFDDPMTIYFLGLYHYLLGVHQIRDTKIVSLGVGLEDYINALEQSKERQLVSRVTAFRSLGDKTRYEILRHIAMGEDSNKVLAKKLNVTSPNISYHIRTLLNENLILIDVHDNRSHLVINKKIFSEHLHNLSQDLGIDVNNEYQE